MRKPSYPGPGGPLRTIASLVVAVSLGLAIPAFGDSTPAPPPYPAAGFLPDITTLEQFDVMLDARNDLAWSARENMSGTEFDVLGRPLADYFDQYLFTVEAESVLKTLRAQAAQQAAAGDQTGLAGTLQRAHAAMNLENYRMRVIYAHFVLSTGLVAHEAALKAFLDKSPPEEQAKTQARLDPMLKATRQHLIELLEAPTLADAKKGVESTPDSPLPKAYNEERMRLAPFVHAWDSEHGIAPMSRTRSTACDPPYPTPSTTDEPSLDQSILTLPEFPVIARRHGFEGVVHIRAEISAKGCADRMEIVRSVGYEPLDSSALVWAEGIRFHPVLVDGEPGAASYTFAVTFRLTN